jgi:hypothetical protein
MNDILLHTHSVFRWVALLFLILAIFNAVVRKSKGEYTNRDKKLNLFAMLFFHIQALGGVFVYLNSSRVSFDAGWMRNAGSRFFTMEHGLLMLVAVVLITIGRKKAEKSLAPIVKHKKIVAWYTISLLIVLLSIPWPFREVCNGAWF